MSFIKKHRFDIIMLLSLLCLFTCTHIFIPINILDETWKYIHTKAFLDGYVFYDDINLITTPFYFLLSSLFLLFNKSMFAFRIMEIIMWAFTFFLIYRILKKKYTKENAFIITILGTVFITNFTAYIFDYNALLLTLSLLIVCWFNNDKEKKTKSYLYLGILFALTDLTKQSVGLFIALFGLSYLIFSKKETIKNKMFCILGFFIPNFLFLIYLLATNTFGAFFDFCLFGLGNFNNNISLLNYCSNNPIGIVYVLFIVITIGYCIYDFIKNKNKENILYIGLIILLFILTYPIFDFSHLTMVLSFSYCTLFTKLSTTNIEMLKKYKEIIVLFTYFIFFIVNMPLIKLSILICFGVFLILFIVLNLLKNYKIKEKYKNIYSVICFVSFVLVINIILGFSYVKDLNLKQSTMQNFSHLYIREDLESTMIDNNNYFKEHYSNYAMFSSSCCLYSIMNDEYNGYLDVFDIGNFGTKTPTQCVQEYIENENYEYIILKKNYKEENWQNPKEIVDYIENNLTKIDEYGNFDIYEK